jgi:hypothetical protein
MDIEYGGDIRRVYSKMDTSQAVSFKDPLGWLLASIKLANIYIAPAICFTGLYLTSFLLITDKKDDINEAVDPISILSYVLAGTTLTNIIAKYVGKLFKKYNFGKGEAAAKKIYDFTHKLEGDFKKPIGRVVGLFTKDEKAKNMVTDGLFALLLLGLGAKAGTEVFSAVRKSNLISGGISGLKAALKGKDLATLIQDTISAV